MKINLVEFKWNSARCAKTKTECFEEPKNFASEAKGKHPSPHTHTHTNTYTLLAEHELNLPTTFTLVSLSAPRRIRPSGGQRCVPIVPDLPHVDRNLSSMQIDPPNLLTSTLVTLPYLTLTYLTLVYCQGQRAALWLAIFIMP